jgi:lipoprotein-releasing system ATP-binding protein
MQELLKVQALTKRFAFSGSGVVDVFHDVSFSVTTGEVVTLTGPSGSGKSTLLNIIGTLDTPTSGNVLLANEDLIKLSKKELASRRNKKIGFIFQFHHLLPEFTAIENVAMPALIAGEDKETAMKKAKQLLDEVGLGSRLEHRPAELSGGEAQRTAVARAFIMNPAIVLADEPTGNLDLENSNKLFSLILDLSKSRNQTFLIVTHNADLAERATRRLHLEGGILHQ